MASQIEIASSAPFGCALRDHNRQDRFRRENNSRDNAASVASQAAFRKNLKDLVRDHLHSCISVSPGSSSNEHSQNPVNNCNFDHHQHQYTSYQDSSILDRWASEQARGMLSTLKNQGQEADLLIASPNSHNSKLENPPTSSNRGASSLVQIWEARMHQPERKIDRSNSLKNNQNMYPSTSRTSSASSYNEIIPSAFEEPSRNPDIIDSATNENPMSDCDSTVQSSRSSVNFRSSDVGENERVRIADIIKRLTSDSSDHDQGNSVCESGLRRHSYGSDQSELRSFAQIVNSPKIRGRQAFHDLLCQMKQERHQELETLSHRQSVCRFPHRGRIQAMLRLICLKRGVEIEDQQRSLSIRSTLSFDANRSSQRSTITHLSPGGVEQATSSQSDAAPQTNAKMNHNNSINDETPSTENPVITEDNHRQDFLISDQQQPEILSSTQISEAVSEEASAIIVDVPSQEASSEGENLVAAMEASGSVLSFNNWDVSEVDNEVFADQQDYGESSYDWFSEVARPRSYWEDQRQAWYQEMLGSDSGNGDIRQLIERKTVSNFLASDFRQRMDQLMEFHAQRQSNREEEEQLEDESQERIGQLILSFFRRHSQPSQGELDGRDEEIVENEQQQQQHHEEEEEDEESPPSVQSLSPSRSWNYNLENQDAVFDNSTYQHRQYFSSPISHQSTEMELIYDLRGHMEQMQVEMSELRKSMEACMEIQVKVHNSLNLQLHPGPQETRRSMDTVTKRRNCCICYEMQVDSFLYRCGHMCTCVKCGHELQWSSGKCPICRASILDVVRAYTDS